jgi:Ras-related GTP-binding protein A/B
VRPARQDAFTETYLTTQRKYMFSDVGVLIHVWDIESRGSDEDEYGTYRRIIGALEEYSPHCHVFGLVHKIDLVQQGPREEVIAKKTDTIRSNSGSFADSLICYPTTIWDQSLYRAWGSIVNRLIPNLSIIEDYLNHLAHAIDAEEVVLFERTTFLTVMSVTTAVGQQNPCYDRHERLSNIIKTFKHSLA